MAPATMRAVERLLDEDTGRRTVIVPVDDGWWEGGPLNVEHTRVDLTEVPEARVGDEVVIIGSQGAAEISPQEVVEHNKLRVGELAPAVRDSVPKVYLT